MNGGLGHVAVVGAGRAGLTLATGLACGGVADIVLLCRDQRRRDEVRRWVATWPVAGSGHRRVVSSVEASLQRSDTVIFATPDRGLADAAAAWVTGDATSDGQVWLHLSGLQPPAVLRVDGGSEQVGSVHPLAALPDPLLGGSLDSAALEVATRPLRGALFALAGDGAAVKRGRIVAETVGGTAVELGVDRRAAYHAAATVVANDMVALVAIGERLCQRAGLEPAVARSGLLHLARTSLEAIESRATRSGVSLADGLTGAVGRGDASSVASHVEALSDDTDARAAHVALSRVLLALVEQAGILGAADVAAVEQALGDLAPDEHA